MHLPNLWRRCPAYACIFENLTASRLFSTSNSIQGKRKPRKYMPPGPSPPKLQVGYRWPPGRKYPNDRRKEVTEVDVGPSKYGGSKRAAAMYKILPETGWVEKGKYKEVPEMIPEFIVPDLTDFELKPYVAYNVPDVVQSEFTAENLFEACYAKSVVEQVKEGEHDPTVIVDRLQNSTSDEQLHS